jgi:hypothetical protein
VTCRPLTAGTPISRCKSPQRPSQQFQTPTYSDRLTRLQAVRSRLRRHVGCLLHVGTFKGVSPPFSTSLIQVQATGQQPYRLRAPKFHRRAEVPSHIAMLAAPHDQSYRNSYGAAFLIEAKLITDRVIVPVSCNGNRISAGRCTKVPSFR